MGTIEERFWAKVVKGDGCWQWVGAKVSGGYGIISMPGGRKVLTHRLSWELANGTPIPAGMQVQHFCDKPSCVRPDHLRIGTHAENMADCCRKGRAYTLLTKEQAADAMEALSEGERGVDVALRFGVTPQYVSDLRHGRVWKHLGIAPASAPCHARGPRVAKAKLTEAQAQEAVDRLAAGDTRRTIAEALGVSWYAINDIRRGRTWKHLGR